MTPDDNKELVEIVARALAEFWGVNLDKHPDLIGQQARIALTAIESSGRRIVPVEPTEAQLNAARDWAVAKYGQGVGNDGASGCYRAMLSASPKVTP